MADFIYQEPYPIEKETTEYELLTTDYVKVESATDVRF